MKFNISILVFATLFAVSCKNGKPSHNTGKLSDKNGGTFSMAENNEVGTLFPHTITSQVEGLITSQIHECLVKLNPKTLEVIPGLAEKWETSADGRIITFHLVKGAFFQDDKCYKMMPGLK